MVLNWLTEQRDKLRDEVSKFQNRNFMEAVVAACALVAVADGSIDPEEKRKMVGFIQNNDALKAFKMDDVIASFNKITAKLDFDMSIGKAEALAVIAKIKKNDAEARLAVRVASAIAASDGTVDEQEIAVMRTICNELGLNPSDFDL